MKRLKYAISLLFLIGVGLIVASLVSAVFNLTNTYSISIIVLLGLGMIMLAMLGALMMITIQQSKHRKKLQNNQKLTWQDNMFSVFEILSKGI